MQKSLKILFFHNTLPEYRIGWFRNLAQNADVQFVFTNEQLNKKEYGFTIEYEKIRDLKCKFLLDGKQGIKDLKQIMGDSMRYDFVELPPIDSLREVIYSAYIVYVCKKKNIKIGYFWEKWEAPWEKQPLKRRVKNLILRVIPGLIYKRADVIFSVGRKNREYFISNGVKEKKIVWIPDVSETPDCDYIDLREKFNIPSECKIIMYLGRLLPQKGVGDLIKAYSRLNSDIKEKCYLLIAGDGVDLENCKRLTQMLKLNNVCFTGSVNPAQRGNYFAQCDIFVYPVNYYQGWCDVWGLTLNEAVQHGKIVIATDAVGSAYELIKNGVNGFRIEAGNIEQLKSAILNALSQKIAWTAMVKDVELKKIFSYAEMGKRYIEVVEKIVG